MDVKEGEKTDESTNSTDILNKDHLLGLILEFKHVKKSVALKKINVSNEVINEWIIELEKEGWISVSEIEYDDPIMEITSKGLDEAKHLMKNLQEEQSREDEADKPKISTKQAFKGAADKSKIQFKSFIASFINNSKDILVVVSILLSVSLLYQFLQNPNTYVLNFLLGAFLLSLTLILYRQYENYLKTRQFLSFMEWCMMLVNLKRKYIAAILTLTLMIYISGLLIRNPDNLAVYIMGYMIVLSTALLLYYPKETISDALKFYMGMIQLTYSLLLISGLVTISEIFLVAKSSTIDVVIGLSFLLILQLNQETFGVGPKEFKKMVDRKF